MLNQFSRTQLLLDKESMDRLFNARATVFGIGGVGGYTVEALNRFYPRCARLMRGGDLLLWGLFGTFGKHCGGRACPPRGLPISGRPP